VSEYKWLHNNTANLDVFAQIHICLLPDEQGIERIRGWATVRRDSERVEAWLSTGDKHQMPDIESAKQFVEAIAALRSQG